MRKNIEETKEEPLRIEFNRQNFVNNSKSVLLGHVDHIGGLATFIPSLLAENDRDHNILTAQNAMKKLTSDELQEIFDLLGPEDPAPTTLWDRTIIN